MVKYIRNNKTGKIFRQYDFHKYLFLGTKFYKVRDKNSREWLIDMRDSIYQYLPQLQGQLLW